MVSKRPTLRHWHERDVVKGLTMNIPSLVCLLWLLLDAPFAVAKTLNGFDLSDADIPVNEVVSGGPPRDGIPSIDQPRFIGVNEAAFMDDDDRVLGVQIRGQDRAYPIAILNWHEVVNDRIDNQHFVVTYCPLCGTGMVFAANFADSALQFGVSGLLYNSDVLLYDRVTGSLWSQILGRAISGPLKGTPLPQIPAMHTTWARWKEQNPRTLVLSTDTGYRRDYSQSPYRGYERTPRLYFDVSSRAPRTYHPKALVMGVTRNGVQRVYPFDELRRFGRSEFSDTVNGAAVQVHWDEAASSAHLTDAEGKPLPTTIGYWFAWYAFYPETEVFKAPR